MNGIFGVGKEIADYYGVNGTADILQKCIARNTDRVIENTSKVDIPLIKLGTAISSKF